MARTGSFRGGIPINEQVYGAWTDELYLISKDGNATYYSTLSGTDYPSFARNTASPQPHIAFVTENGAFIVDTTAAAVQSYPDADVNNPGTPQCCCGYLGFIFFGYNNGMMAVSKYNSLTVSTLDQGAARTNPDGIKAIFGYQGQVFAMGGNTVELFGEPINATGFPLTRTGFNLTPGIIGKHAVAGWQDEFGHPPIYVGSDGTVRQIQGYQATRISNTDLDRDIREVAAVDHDSINCCVYNTGGHAFWQVNLPTKSWVYHVNEGTWHARESQDLTKSRLINSVPFRDEWLVGDTENENVYKMDIDSRVEGVYDFPVTMESGDATDFPYRGRIARGDFQFTVGVGVTTGTDPEATDPQVNIEISRDGGHTWPHSWDRKLGMEANYRKRVTVTNAGVATPAGPRWRWTVSDPVHIGFMGGDMMAGPRGK